jgi:hypothetical protein
MTDIRLVNKCASCNGTGIRVYWDTATQTNITENPCTVCGGDGKTPSSTGVDETVFNQILTELDYIHGKVTAIWNQIKP